MRVRSVLLPSPDSYGSVIELRPRCRYAATHTCVV